MILTLPHPRPLYHFCPDWRTSEVENKPDYFYPRFGAQVLKFSQIYQTNVSGWIMFDIMIFLLYLLHLCSLQVFCCCCIHLLKRYYETAVETAAAWCIELFEGNKLRCDVWTQDFNDLRCEFRQLDGHLLWINFLPLDGTELFLYYFTKLHLMNHGNGSLDEKQPWIISCGSLIFDVPVVTASSALNLLSAGKWTPSCEMA